MCERSDHPKVVEPLLGQVSNVPTAWAGWVMWEGLEGHLEFVG